MKVSVENATKTMAQALLAEKDVECMNDDEYCVFEELQVQIYVGRCKEEMARKRQRTDNH